MYVFNFHFFHFSLWEYVGFFFPTNASTVNLFVDNSVFYSGNEKGNLNMPDEDRGDALLVPTRIAVYDDLLAAPRIVDIEPSDIASYIEHIAAKTYELAQAQGSSIPYTVIREVCENFIHAKFMEPCVSILDHGNTIRFTDQGPGIDDKERAQQPGFTSATSEMRKYIRGVGSGLPQVREYLKFSNGRLIIEDNIKAGTVVTITVDDTLHKPTPVVYRETPSQAAQRQAQQEAKLDERENDILILASDIGLIGPTEVNQQLGISISTAHRELKKLEDAGYLMTAEGSRKRMLSDKGFKLLNGQV